MKLLTPCIALSLIASSSFALASFDLMFLPDATTNRVVRFDPANRIALGSFGDFASSGPRYVGIGTENRAYVTDNEGTTIMNAYTGNIIGGRQFPNSKVSVSSQGDRLYTIPGGTAFGRYTGNLSSLFGNAAPTNLYSVVAVSDTFGIGFGNGAGNQLVAHVYNGSSLSSTSVTTNFPAVNFALMGASQARNDSTTASWMICYPGLNGMSLVRQYCAGTTDLTTGATVQTSGVLNLGTEFNIASSVMAMPAHEGWWLVGDDATTPTTTRISYYGRDFTRQFSYTTTAVNVPTSEWGGHIVLAPEPGTMSALALGAVALLRKRKKSQA